MTIMKQAPDTEIDLSDWDFSPNLNHKVIKNVMSRAFEEVLEKAIKDGPMLVFRPRNEGDIATLEVSLPITKDEVCWHCALEEVVDDLIESYMHPHLLKINEPEGKDIARKLAMRLKELAEKLEDACTKDTL